MEKELVKMSVRAMRCRLCMGLSSKTMLFWLSNKHLLLLIVSCWSPLLLLLRCV